MSQPKDKPPMNECVSHPPGYGIHHSGGYGIYKEARKIKGVVHCILVDPHTPGYANPAVKGDRYAVPIEQCTWAAPMGHVDVTAIALPVFAAAPGPVTHAWITPDKPEWWQDFEQRLIEATTLEQLHQAKSKLSTTRRTQIMDVWQTDGRYEWLKANAERLQTEANAVEQGNLTGGS